MTCLTTGRASADLRRCLRTGMTASFLFALAIFVPVFDRTGHAAKSSREDVTVVSDSQNEAAAQSMGAVTAALWQGETLPQSIPAILQRDDVAVYLAVRRQGVKITDIWTRPQTGVDALKSAIEQVKRSSQAAANGEVAELVIAYAFRPVPRSKRNAWLSNLSRGIYGIEIKHGETMERVGPTQMIASNRSFDRVIKRFSEQHKIDLSTDPDAISVHRFAAEQYLIHLESNRRSARMFRGNSLVRDDFVTQGSIASLARRMSDWMIRNVRDSGRMTYKYWPSSGKESSANNMIRQWMATVSLIRAGRHFGDETVAEIAGRNIAYNLRKFYMDDGEFGSIEYGGKVKLGALALAALALHEHPDSVAFRTIEGRLRNTILRLQADDGSFRTFLKPAGRNDNQNFYPGEALVYLTSVYAQNPDSDLLARIRKSIDYYWQWHQDNRNPAFIPWHTMAYSQLWRQTRDADLVDKILAMNDWLLGMQQKPSERFPDTDGRFYDPDRRQFGPPHASSTGVYLESFIQAFRVARETGDTARAETYRIAILRGLRSLMQLEFRDNVDMYYVSKRDLVRGGIRTTVYDNTIRVDNVQHNLMAVLEILNAFKPGDYLP